MKNADIKHVKDEIKSVMKNDEYIPARFAFLNGAMYGCGVVLLASKRVWVKAACLALEGLVAYKMNGEMAKFMDAMLNGKQAYDLDHGCMTDDNRQYYRYHINR